MTDSRRRAPTHGVTGARLGQGSEVWPHPYQVDHAASPGPVHPLRSSIRGMRASLANRRRSLLLVSAAGVSFSR